MEVLILRAEGCQTDFSTLLVSSNHLYDACDKPPRDTLVQTGAIEALPKDEMMQKEGQSCGKWKCMVDTYGVN